MIFSIAKPERKIKQLSANSGLSEVGRRVHNGAQTSYLTIISTYISALVIHVSILSRTINDGLTNLFKDAYNSTDPLRSASHRSKRSP